jgi:hypothetical protein
MKKNWTMVLVPVEIVCEMLDTRLQDKCISQVYQSYSKTRERFGDLAEKPGSAD